MPSVEPVTSIDLTIVAPNRIAVLLTEWRAIMKWLENTGGWGESVRRISKRRGECSEHRAQSYSCREADSTRSRGRSISS
mmetsp:Transcript_20934/g.45654  ORF Transcript_20934/g.45654 Transcript_20934/m.45654 type:complete len:80 (+) Transcript_20934:943-1182(+)